MYALRTNVTYAILYILTQFLKFILQTKVTIDIFKVRRVCHAGGTVYVQRWGRSSTLSHPVRTISPNLVSDTSHRDSPVHAYWYRPSPIVDVDAPPVVDDSKWGVPHSAPPIHDSVRTIHWMGNSEQRYWNTSYHSIDGDVRESISMIHKIIYPPVSI